MNWVRYMVKAHMGHELSDSALCEVRLGALYALRDSADVLVWTQNMLEGMASDADKDWAIQIKSIDFPSLKSFCDVASAVVQDNFDLFQELPKDNKKNASITSNDIPENVDMHSTRAIS